MSVLLPGQLVLDLDAATERDQHPDPLPGSIPAPRIVPIIEAWLAKDETRHLAQLAEASEVSTTALRRLMRGETNTLRFGMRHTFTPASVLLGSVILQDMDSRVTDQIPEAGIDNLDLKTDAQSVGAELQHLYRSTYFNLVTGAGYFHVDGETVSNTQIGSDSVREVIDAGLDHVEDLATAMHERDVTHLPVVDQQGNLVGIVARGDLVRFIARTT